jgi:hypothetical protein
MHAATQYLWTLDGPMISRTHLVIARHVCVMLALAKGCLCTQHSLRTQASLGLRVCLFPLCRLSFRASSLDSWRLHRNPVIEQLDSSSTYSVPKITLNDTKMWGEATTMRLMSSTARSVAEPPTVS